MNVDFLSHGFVAARLEPRVGAEFLITTTNHSSRRGEVSSLTTHEYVEPRFLASRPHRQLLPVSTPLPHTSITRAMRKRRIPSAIFSPRFDLTAPEAISRLTQGTKKPRRSVPDPAYLGYWQLSRFAVWKGSRENAGTADLAVPGQRDLTAGKLCGLKIVVWKFLFEAKIADEAGTGRSQN